MTATPIRVGLDVTAAVVGATGVGRYASEVARGLSTRRDVVLSAFAVGRGLPPPIPARHPPVPLRVIDLAWRTLGWPNVRWLSGDVDLVHTLDLVPPPGDIPTVVTIHDLFGLTHPAYCPPATASLHRRQADAARRAAMVITTCDAMADEITALLGIPAARLAVARPGIRPAAPGGGTGAGGGFILAVGGMTPRKGFDVLAAAANLLPNCPPIRIVGPDGYASDAARAALRAADAKGMVELVGPVDDDQLAGLYRDAILVCHPSIAEGFGMVCLEAMALAKCVVASDLAPIREMAGGTVAMFPNGDPRALAERLEALLADGAERARLGAAAAARAAGFTWERTADEIVAGYRRALGPSGA